MALEIENGILRPADFVNVRSGLVFWISLQEVLLILFVGFYPPGDPTDARTHDYFERECSAKFEEFEKIFLWVG